MPNPKVAQFPHPSAEPAVSWEDFYSYMPMHGYLFVPTSELWPAASVNARLPAVTPEGAAQAISATKWLDEHRPVEQMTWCPGEPLIIHDRLVAPEGGWILKPGCRTFNQYRPPQIGPGDPGEATRWREHLTKLYPDDHGHIERWLAHRVQRPGEKINHALVLAGPQGIGKDAVLAPITAAIGPWNFADVSPSHLFGRFNKFLKAVILRINEAHDLGDIDRYAFYDHTKTITAAPPDTLRIDEKHVPVYSVWNVCGVIITSNHRTDGIYLPAEDRRHYVTWSPRTKDDFAADYWTTLYGWYADGGSEHVAAYLASVDLTTFDAKAPPPKTDAFWDVVNASRVPEAAELADVIDALKEPPVTTLAQLATEASKTNLDFSLWLRDRRHSRQVPHRLEAVGYVPVRNSGAKDGLWVVNKRRTVIYGRTALSPQDRLDAATALTNQ